MFLWLCSSSAVNKITSVCCSYDRIGLSVFLTISGKTEVLNCRRQHLAKAFDQEFRPSPLVHTRATLQFHVWFIAACIAPLLSGSIQRTVQIQAPICLTGYAVAVIPVTTIVQFFFGRSPSSLDCVLRNLSFGSRGDLTYGLEHCDRKFRRELQVMKLVSRHKLLWQKKFRRELQRSMAAYIICYAARDQTYKLLARLNQEKYYILPSKYFA